MEKFDGGLDVVLGERSAQIDIVYLLVAAGVLIRSVIATCIYPIYDKVTRNSLSHNTTHRRQTNTDGDFAHSG